MQKETYKEEYSALVSKKELSSSSKLLGLRSKLDSDGIIRSDVHLTYTEFLSYDVRYPVILPCKNWVTKLIVMNWETIKLVQTTHNPWYQHVFELYQPVKKSESGRKSVRCAEG